MSTFLDLQNGFYNALVQGLGFSPKDPVQLIQPSTPLADGAQASQLLWNYFNNIPPISLTQNYISGGGNQFGSDYSALLSALLGAKNNFRADVGEDCFKDWQAYLRQVSPPITPNQMPMAFRNWAMMNGYQSVAARGASDLAQLMLDPISNAQMSMMLYTPAGGVNPINWIPDFSVLKRQLAQAPSRQFSISSSSMNSNVSSSWTQGRNSGFFGLWGGSSYQSSYSAQFASSNVQVDASFAHVLPFYATPGDWYNSGAMALAYSNQTGAPWDPSKPEINWKNTFSEESGSMPRFATALVVVDTMNVLVKSDATFSQQDQQTIQNNGGAGMWPFYSKNSSSGSNTDVSFDTQGHMTVQITSQPDAPIVVALTVLPVDQYLGHHLA